MARHSKYTASSGTDVNFNLLNWEKYYHVVIWPCALAVSLYPLTQGMYNINHNICWLAPLPNSCQFDNDVACQRGQEYGLWSSLTSLIAMVHLVYSMIVMLCIYCSVRDIENRRSRLSLSRSTKMTTVMNHPQDEEEGEDDDSCEAEQGSAPVVSSSRPAGRGITIVASQVSDLSHSHIESVEDDSCQAEQGTARKPMVDDMDTSCAAATATATRASASTVNRRYSRAVGKQGMLYALGMIVTNLPTAAYVIVFNVTGFSNDTMRECFTALIPLIGYVNFTIFMRKRSLDDCHSSYAKFLRRLHSGLWDRQWKCCQCFHWEHWCWPFRRDKGSVTEQSSAIPQHHDSPIKYVGGNNTNTQLQSIEEDGILEEHGYYERTKAVSSTTNVSRNTWTGFLISLGMSRGSSKAVSELAGSEFENNDLTPHMPVRIHSEAALPPVLPRRQTSFLSEASQSENIEMHDTSHRTDKSAEPPTMPKRVMSSAEQPEESDNSRWRQQSNRTLTSERSGGPPQKPERVQSAVELVDEDDHRSFLQESACSGVTGKSVDPPRQPSRIVSDVEQSDDDSNSQVSFWRDKTNRTQVPPQDQSLSLQ